MWIEMASLVFRLLVDLWRSRPDRDVVGRVVETDKSRGDRERLLGRKRGVKVDADLIR